MPESRATSAADGNSELPLVLGTAQRFRRATRGEVMTTQARTSVQETG
jgi:hypothetical protein